MARREEQPPGTSTIEATGGPRRPGPASAAERLMLAIRRECGPSGPIARLEDVEAWLDGRAREDHQGGPG